MQIIKSIIFILIGMTGGSIAGFILSIIIETIFPAFSRLLAGTNNGGWNSLASGVIFYFMIIILTVIGLLVGGYIGYRKSI